MDHSNSSRLTKPPSSRMAVPARVSLLCSDQWRGSRKRLRRSCRTGKPIPPMTIAVITGSRIRASLA
ncbi:hypothetical protein D3C80_1827750 [compost metagenome]